MKSTYVFIIVAIAIAKRNSWRFSSKGKNDRNQFTIYSVFSVYKDFCFSSPWAFFLQRVTGNIVIVYCFVCHKLYKAKKKKTNYLNSHGEEAQENKATGLIRNGFPQLDN